MLTRRQALATVLFTLVPGVALAQQGPLKPYRFRVRTKSGGIGGTVIMARDPAEAIHKVQQRYKGCTILNEPRKVVATYTVQFSNQGVQCNCPDFRSRHRSDDTCKHIKALQTYWMLR